MPDGMVRMVPGTVTIDGRRWRYAVSDNDGWPWAVNLHGFFAGGSMYWRESARLAGALGWKVLNPSLPGFGGTDPVPWEELTMGAFADGVRALMDHVGAGRAVVLGHSMGGAIAVRFATDHPDRTLGVVYRDGAGTGSWRERNGVVARLLAPVSPDLGVMVELVGAALADVPDLAWGRVRSTAGALIPDARRNMRSLTATLPVAAMLLTCDLSAEAAALGADPAFPLLPVWGRFDRIVPRATAEEFGKLVGRSVVWVTGGHSWMLPRPNTQGAILRRHPLGQDFLRALEARNP